MCIGWNVRCVARNEKNVRMRAYGGALSVHNLLQTSNLTNSPARKSLPVNIPLSIF